MRKGIGKFRGIKSNGDFIYGSLFYSENLMPAIYFEVANDVYKNIDFAYVKAETVGEFTGLYDKYGVEIYEGDVIQINKNTLFEIVYDSPSFLAKPKKGQSYFFSTCLDIVEVIGNIHQNSNLLK